MYLPKAVSSTQKREIHNRAQHLLDRSKVCVNRSLFVVVFFNKAERDREVGEIVKRTEKSSSLSLVGFVFVFEKKKKKKNLISSLAFFR